MPPPNNVRPPAGSTSTPSVEIVWTDLNEAPSTTWADGPPVQRSEAVVQGRNVSGASHVVFDTSGSAAVVGSIFTLQTPQIEPSALVDEILAGYGPNHRITTDEASLLLRRYASDIGAEWSLMHAEGRNFYAGAGGITRFAADYFLANGTVARSEDGTLSVDGKPQVDFAEVTREYNTLLRPFAPLRAFSASQYYFEHYDEIEAAWDSQLDQLSYPDGYHGFVTNYLISFATEDFIAEGVVGLPLPPSTPGTSPASLGLASTVRGEVPLDQRDTPVVSPPDFSLPPAHFGDTDPAGPPIDHGSVSARGALAAGGVDDVPVTVRSPRPTLISGSGDPAVALPRPARMPVIPILPVGKR